MPENNFQNRISFRGDLSPVLENVCADFAIGKYSSHQIVTTGYEDLNIIVSTNSGKYFLKIFSDFRSIDDCKRYIDIVTKVLEAGVHHPKLFKYNDEYLYQDGSNDIRLCVMEFIDGNTFYDFSRKLSNEEIKKVVDEVIKINKINYKPAFMYDSWAISSILDEYEIIKNYLNEDDLKLVSPLIEKFASIDQDSLPHSLVHGDLIKPNVLLSKDEQIYVIDFSVANYAPRIQELAVLFCNMFFDKKDDALNNEIFKKVIDQYCKEIALTELELSLLPFYIDLAHAMHIIGANSEKYLADNDSAENQYWLNLGRSGLKKEIHVRS